MTRRELALLQTARSTQACLDQHEETWKTVPGFVQQREAIRERMTELEEMAGDAGTDPGNLAGQRQAAIQALAEQAWVMAGQVQAWAAVHGDEDVRRAASATRDELVWLQMRLPERALRIQQMAAACLRQGGEAFGLTAAALDRLAERIQALKILRVPAAKAVRTEENGVPREEGDLDGALNQVMDLLCEVADPLMRRFRVEAPGFYEAYQAARRIVDPETGTLLTSEEELASLDEESWSGWEEAEIPGRAGGRRSVAPGAGSRVQDGAAVLNA